MKGIELLKIRQEMGLNQDEFGQLLSVSKNTILNWEKSEQLSNKALRLLAESDIKGINIYNNKAGRDQNFLNEPQASYNKLDYIEVMKDNKRLSEELVNCQKEIIQILKNQKK